MITTEKLRELLNKQYKLLDYYSKQTVGTLNDSKRFSASTVFGDTSKLVVSLGAIKILQYLIKESEEDDNKRNLYKRR